MRIFDRCGSAGKIGWFVVYVWTRSCDSSFDLISIPSAITSFNGAFHLANRRWVHPRQVSGQFCDGPVFLWLCWPSTPKKPYFCPELLFGYWKSSCFGLGYCRHWTTTWHVGGIGLGQSLLPKQCPFIIRCNCDRYAHVCVCRSIPLTCWIHHNIAHRFKLSLSLRCTVIRRERERGRPPHLELTIRPQSFPKLFCCSSWWSWQHKVRSRIFCLVDVSGWARTTRQWVWST